MKRSVDQYILNGVYFFYKRLVSPVIHVIAGPGQGCRFEPTCGDYAFQVIQERGPVRGVFAAIVRVLKCGPWSIGGR